MSAADDALLASFLDCTLPPEQLGHPEHVRLAYLFVRRHPDFGDAALAFRSALRRYVTAIGRADRYHETLTWAYLALIAERIEREGEEPPVDSQQFVARWPELVDHRTGAFAAAYDVAEITASPLARRVFLLPGRRAP
jgi:hypothetical protein